MMSYRRKSAKPTNRRCLNLKPTQMDEEGRGEEESDEEQLTIPPDLFHDFLQLKSSTHLNTTQLMRKLLKEYNSQSVSGSESEQEEKLHNGSHDSQPPDDKMLLAGSSYEVIAESRVSQTTAPDGIMDFDQPLDLTVDKTPTGSRGGSPVHLQPFVHKMSPLSMHLPTIPVRNNHLPFVKSEAHTPPSSVSIKTEPNPQPPPPTSTGFSPALATPENLSELSNQLVLNGIGNLIAVPFVPSGQLPPTLSAVSVPLKGEAPVSSSVSQQPQQPRRMKPGRKPRGGGVSRSQKSNGEMKIIAENTLFPGVYTSILKLPWSRRSRNKPPSGIGTPSSGLPTAVVDSSEAIPSSVISPSTAATNPNNTLLLPASSQTIMSATTSQSVMMVYPNASISAVGKPVRRRGRPPKLPMLSHLLSEKKAKKQTAETHVTSISDRILPIPTALSEAAPLAPGVQFSSPSMSQFEIPAIKMEPPSSSPPSSPKQAPASGAAVSSIESNGSIYQEMIMSSKSNQLVSVRPRRRSQTEVKRGSDFMWTSFKIKPRGGKMYRPKKQPPSNLDTSLVEEDHEGQAQTEMETEEDNGTPSMFQELYHCKICNAILPADGKLEHQREHQPTMLKCSQCQTPFLSYVHKDSDVGKLSCERCTKNGSVYEKITSNGNNFSCDLCEGSFKSFHAFNDHRHKVHGNEKITLDTHSCLECGKIFFTTKGLNHHMKTHTDKAKFQPVENGSKLFHSPASDNVERGEVEMEREELECTFDDCSRKFQALSELQEHVRCTHSTGGQHFCPWPGCNKEFPTERHLKLHILIHSDEKPMKCDFCDYRCRQRNALNWHMRKHPEAAYKYRKYTATLGGE